MTNIFFQYSQPIILRSTFGTFKPTHSLTWLHLWQDNWILHGEYASHNIRKNDFFTKTISEKHFQQCHRHDTGKHALRPAAGNVTGMTLGIMLYIRLQAMSQAWHWEACFTYNCRQCHRHDTGKHALRPTAGNVTGMTLGSTLYVRLQAMSQEWHNGKHALRPAAGNVTGMTLGSTL
jgi:cytochrome c2